MTSKPVKIVVLSDDNKDIEYNYSYQIITKFSIIYKAEIIKTLGNITELKYLSKIGITIPLKFCFVTDLSEYNSFCESNIDSYIIFINLEDKNSMNQLKSIVSYIQNFSNYNLVNTYIIGLFDKSEDKKFNEKEANDFLKELNFQANYIEINKDKISKALDGLFITTYEGKRAKEKCEMEDYEDDENKEGVEDKGEDEKGDDDVNEEEEEDKNEIDVECDNSNSKCYLM